MTIITLSRAPFSGAGELAGQISGDLGYSLISRDDVIEKTAQYGMSRHRQDRARHQRLGLLPRMTREWVRYLVFARAALVKEIKQGSLMYLGGNGRALLKDFPNVLNVRVAADLDYRVDNLIRRSEYTINRKKAKQTMKKATKKRRRSRK